MMRQFGSWCSCSLRKRHLRRDGIEVLGYDTIAKGSPIALSNPDLAGCNTRMRWVPRSLLRPANHGGLVDVEFKPAEHDTLDLTAFSSRMLAKQLQSQLSVLGNALHQCGPGPSASSGLHGCGQDLDLGDFAPVAGTDYGVYDQISRPDEEGHCEFRQPRQHLERHRRADDLRPGGLLVGDGKTPEQDVSRPLRASAPAPPTN